MPVTITAPSSAPARLNADARTVQGQAPPEVLAAIEARTRAASMNPNGDQDIRVRLLPKSDEPEDELPPPRAKPPEPVAPVAVKLPPPKAPQPQPFVPKPPVAKPPVAQKPPHHRKPKEAPLILTPSF